VYKALGLEYRRPDGSFWRVNDSTLDPIWVAAAGLGIPVLIHTADPAAFWQPMEAQNFWNGVVYGEYDWWAYYGKDVPGYQELLGERNEMIARHPGTTFICPHVGSKADCLDNAADDLEALPNLYYDISARIPTLGRDQRRAAHAREFLLAYQDRIMLGTDIIYDDGNVATGMQAQALFQPGEVPLNGANREERYIETTVAFFESYLRFLRTGDLQVSAPFKRNLTGFVMHGLDLPEDVCEKVMWKNAARLLGIKAVDSREDSRHLE
jgi:predicted TIM-barrel fold metal-dependent hydrolase